MKRVHVYIRGRVQGVFFRAATQLTAKELNLTGWVRNMPDGRVETTFEGEDEIVNKMIQWCHKGPPAALVREVLIEEERYSGEYSDFVIRY